MGVPPLRCAESKSRERWVRVVSAARLLAVLRISVFDIAARSSQPPRRCSCFVVAGRVGERC